MSLKLVELQVALPRTYDAGKIQEQLEHRSSDMQDYAMMSNLKNDDTKRKTVGKNEENKDVKFTKEQSSSHHHNQQNKKEKKEELETSKIQHPLKGNFIDIFG